MYTFRKTVQAIWNTYRALSHESKVTLRWCILCELLKLFQVTLRWCILWGLLNKVPWTLEWCAWLVDVLPQTRQESFVLFRTLACETGRVVCTISIPEIKKDIVPNTYLSTHTVYQYKIQFFSLFWGHMAILENGYRKA